MHNIEKMMKKVYCFLSLPLLLCAMGVLVCCSVDDGTEPSPTPAPPVPAEVKRYGVRWSITDVDDLGQRCFDAVGKEAVIGIGLVPGHSDFDDIYPWSEMRRCNIRTTSGGTVITYEGDPGFALDGSNGDVYVRIPRFNVEKYVLDGYEYRVVSESEGRVHSAFVEDGHTLDAIYVSAFEGYIDESGCLRSIAGVIPSSNRVPADFLTAARANGLGYSLYDMRCVDAIWTLLAVEYGCRNTNRVLGYGVADFEQPRKDVAPVQVAAEGTNEVWVSRKLSRVQNYMPVGTNITICRNNSQQDILAQRRITAISQDTESGLVVIRFDGPPVDVDLTCFVGSAAVHTNFCETCGTDTHLAWHTGRCNFVDGSDMRNPVRYRWMENLVGNLWHYLPDVTFKDLQMYVCPDMSGYEFHKSAPPYVAVGGKFPENNDNGDFSDAPGASYWITSLLQGDYPMGATYTHDLTSRQAFGGYYYMSSGTQCIANGGGFDHVWRCNMLTNRAWVSPTRRWYLYGARMMYKQLSYTL